MLQIKVEKSKSCLWHRSRVWVFFKQCYQFRTVYLEKNLYHLSYSYNCFVTLEVTDPMKSPGPYIYEKNKSSTWYDFFSSPSLVMDLLVSQSSPQWSLSISSVLRVPTQSTSAPSVAKSLQNRDYRKMTFVYIYLNHLTWKDDVLLNAFVLPKKYQHG